MKTHVLKQALLAVCIFLSAAGFSQNVFKLEKFPTTSSSGADFTGDLGVWDANVSGSNATARVINSSSAYSAPNVLEIGVTGNTDGAHTASVTSSAIDLAAISCDPAPRSVIVKFRLRFSSVTNNGTSTPFSFSINASSALSPTYTQVYNQSGTQLNTSYNTGQWYPVTLTLPSSYRTANFRLQFVAQRTGAQNNIDNVLLIDDISIVDPAIPDFSADPTLLSVAPAGPANDVYTYQNVITFPTAIDAEIKIESVVNATLDNIDNNDPDAGVTQRFQPRIAPDQTLTADREGYIQFAITFKDHNTGLPVLLEQLRYRHFDIDGSSASNYTFRETGWISGPPVLVNSPSDLASGGNNISSGGFTWNKALGELDEHDGISLDADVYFTAVYSNASVIRFRLGYLFDETTNGATYTAPIREYSTEFGCFDVAQNIPLPVKFSAFNASRTTASNVAVTWATAMEQNNKGFNVQRNVGGEWKTIAFVFSQATNGNSSSDLSYSFKDINNEKGITQYRIQQVDIDGNAKYTDIRAVRGESSASKVVVYPNPSVDGKINVVFDSQIGVKDVHVADMQGRVVKSYNGVTNNILVIEKLTSGFYTIKITNRNTAATSVEKVVVK